MSRRTRGVFLLCTAALIGLAFFVRSGEAQNPRDNARAVKRADAPRVLPKAAAAIGPISGQAVGFVETPPLRDFALLNNEIDPELLTRGSREVSPKNTDRAGRPDPNAPVQYDGALQAMVAHRFVPSIPTPIITFEGVSINDVLAAYGGAGAPPDTVGSIGPNHYVQAVNSTLVRVWNKAGAVQGTFKLSSLFAALGGVAANTDNGDPIVNYDRMADRWVLSQFAFASQTSPPYHQVIAVSKTGDPLGAYWAYDFITPGNEFPDYPKIGVWPDGYYMTTREFTFAAAYNGFGCFALDRAKMLVGDPTASFVYFRLDFNGASPATNASNASSGLVPTEFAGITPPPAGTPQLFAVYTDDAATGDAADAIRLWAFVPNFTTPASSTFLERPESPVAVAAFDSRDPFVFPPFGRGDVEQPPPAVAPVPNPGGSAGDYLDTIGDRLMLRLYYINRGGTELWTTCHTVNAGTIPAPGADPTVAQYKAGKRWYILEKTTPGGAVTVQDQGTYSPDTHERWMGSTAVDNAGNLALGYSISSTTVHPGVRYTGRLLGDPAGTLQPEEVIINGTGVQQQTGNRWGDYSAMTLDPADDATFWYTQQYQAVNGQFSWQTRVGAFKFAGTTAPPQGTLSGLITTCDNGAPLKDAIVQVSGGPSTGFSGTSKSDGTYAFNLSPGNYTVTIIDPAHSCTAKGPLNVTITDGMTTTLDECLSGAAKFLFQSAAISGGNGNNAIDAFECNNLNVTIFNDGCLIGNSVSAVLTSNTPGVTIIQGSSAYPMTAEQAASTNTTPFQVSTSNAFVCGSTIDFTLTVSFTGGSNVLNFSLPTCATAPVVINGALTAGDLQQTARMGRNAIASSCGTQKACPGPLGTGPRLYDLHSFQNGPSPACVTISLTPNCPSGATEQQIFAAAYLNTFNPNNLCTNYRGDIGSSPPMGNALSFSVNVPANATLLVNVHEINPGLVGCPAGYQLTVSGLVGNTFGSGSCGAPTNVVSRKTHPNLAQPVDIALPLVGPSGVENRTGNGGVAGEHTIVVTYPANPVGTTATVTGHNPSGTGDVSTVTFNGNDMIINLTGVSDQQLLSVTTSGGTAGTISVPVGVLRGDNNGTHAVTGGDVNLTKAQVGMPFTGANARNDVNVSGDITGADVNLVKAQAGKTIP